VPPVRVGSVAPPEPLHLLAIELHARDRLRMRMVGPAHDAIHPQVAQPQRAVRRPGDHMMAMALDTPHRAWPTGPPEGVARRAARQAAPPPGEPELAARGAGARARLGGPSATRRRSPPAGQTA